jgi:ribose transport system ATP-binding protein
MNEIELIADKISVLKDGKFVATTGGQTPAEQIVQMMVGRELASVTHVSHVQSEISFEANHLTGHGFKNISFQLHKGEILGFAGLEGSGRIELAKAIFGDGKINGGTILKNGKKFTTDHPTEALYEHVVYLPEDRKTEGLFLDKNISDNIFSARLRKGFYNNSKANYDSQNLCRDFNIKTPTVKKTIRQLSGGNQQKVMLAKWLSLHPDVLIVNEPTHGVDVGAKAEIYEILKKFTAEGRSILLISSELPELLLLCDRIAIMHEGEVKAILNRAEATEEKIAAIASGIQNN